MLFVVGSDSVHCVAWEISTDSEKCDMPVWVFGGSPKGLDGNILEDSEDYFDIQQ